MDMHELYVQATRESLPGAEEKIVHNRFPIMQHAIKAVDTIRRREHRALMARGDESLKGTRYSFIKSQQNLTERQKTPLARAIRLKTGTVGRFVAA